MKEIIISWYVCLVYNILWMLNKELDMLLSVFVK